MEGNSTDERNSEEDHDEEHDSAIIRSPVELDQSTPVPDEPFLVSVAGVAGNLLEWYDFSCYGFFSDIIGDVFFPPDQEGHAALVQSFAVFGAAFLIRPIGGALFGQVGDTKGRKSALEASILLMALPTFAMGCLPTYGMLGWVATTLLVACRLLQGLSVGGQLMSSVVFTLERIDKANWGLVGSSVFAASSVGVTLGSLLSYILRSSLTDEQLRSWGWRVPFLLGVLGIIPGWYLKKYGRERAIPHHPEDVSSSGVDANEHGAPPRRQRSVIAEALGKSNRRALLSCTLVPALPAATYYIVFIWMAIFMEDIVDPPVPHAFAVNTAVGVVGIFGTFLGGWIADCYGHHNRLMILSAIALAVSCPPLVAVIGMGNPGIAFLCQTTLGLLLSVWNGAMIPWIVSSFPPSLRLTSVSIGYNTAVSIFGGFAPAFATLLVDGYGNSAPGYMVTALAALSISGILISPKMDSESDGMVQETSFGGVPGATESHEEADKTREIT